MAAIDREQKKNLLVDTSADEVIFQTSGRSQISFQGDFGGGTVNQYVYTSEGRGAVVRTSTADDSYLSFVQTMEIELTGATDPDLNIIVTRMLNN